MEILDVSFIRLLHPSIVDPLLLMDAYKRLNDTSSDQRDKFLQDKVLKKFILSRWSPNLTDVKIFLFQPTLSTAGIRIFLITSVRLGDEMRLGDWVEEISMPSPSRISSHVPTKAEL